MPAFGYTSLIAVEETSESDSPPQPRARGIPWWVARRVLPLSVLIAVVCGVRSLSGSPPQVATPANTDIAEMSLYAQESTAPPESTASPPSSGATVDGTMSIKFDKDVIGVDVEKAVAETIAEIAGVPASEVSIKSASRDSDGNVIYDYSINVPSDMDANTVSDKLNNSDPKEDSATLNQNLEEAGVNLTAEVQSVTATVPKGGEAECENHDFDEEQCTGKGPECCQWDGQKCMSKVGDKPCGPVCSIQWASHPDKCYEVKDGSTQNGNNIQLSQCSDGNDNQLFRGPESSAGMFRWGAHPQFCFDVADGSVENGNNIQLWQCDESGSNTNQLFKAVGGQIVWDCHPHKCLAVVANNIELADCDPLSPLQVFSGCGANPSPVNPCGTTTQAPVNPCGTTTEAPVNPCRTTQAPVLAKLMGALR
jgi:hypothetical protein